MEHQKKPIATYLKEFLEKKIIPGRISVNPPAEFLQESLVDFKTKFLEYFLKQSMDKFWKKSEGNFRCLDKCMEESHKDFLKHIQENF